MTLRELVARLHDRLRRDRLTAELDEELRHHAALAARDNTHLTSHILTSHSLTSRAVAPHAPRPTLNAIREHTRDAWSLGLLDDLLQDLHFAARVLRRNAGFAVAVVLTLALGIGANTAIFSVVDAVLLRALPYAEPDRLVSVWVTPTGSPDERDPASYLDLVDWQRQTAGAFTGLAGYGISRFELDGPEGVEQARAILGMPALYQVLNARPLIGRMPLPEERRLHVAAISERLWRSRYGARRDVVGRAVDLNGVPYTIVGVMPAGFHFPTPDIDLWTSFAPVLEAPGPSPGQPNPWLASRALHAYRVVARLAPGVALPRAEAEINAVQRRLAAADPDDDGGRTIRLRPLRDDDVAGVRRALWTMLGAAALVLLLACANVAHLMLAHTTSRTRELAVRRALGAHRGRVARQLLTESVLLALVAGAAGVGVAYAGTALFVRLSPGDIPHIENVHIDAASLAFALALSSLAGLVFGAAPALLAWNAGLEQTLREARAAGGGGRGRRARALLTAAEVAGAVVLLVGAGLLVRSFAKLLSTDIGVDRSHVLAFHVTFPTERYRSGQDETRTLDAILAAVRALPGVATVGASTSMPPSRSQEIDSYSIEGTPPARPGEAPSALFIPATPGFVEALGIHVTSGRWLATGDDSTATPVAVVSAALVRHALPGVDPLGRRITVSGVARRIVGVVTDAKYEGVGAPVDPTVYVPFAQSPAAFAWTAVKTRAASPGLSASISGALHAIDAGMNARDLGPLDDMVSASVVRPRFQTLLITTFGIVALSLAIVGIYGVVAYGVAQRTSEIGLRLALGATRGGVVALVVRGGLMPVAAGVVAGIVVSLSLAHTMASFVYGIPTTDAVTYAAVSALLGLAALAAVLLPAWRASRTDPGIALRAS